MIGKFGSIGRLLSQSVSLLEQELGDRRIAELLLCSRQFVVEAMREDLRRTKFEIGDPRFARYLVGAMVGAREERLLAVYLDHSSGFIREEVVALGSWNEVSFRLRSLLRRAIELDCAQLVISHNHPSGYPQPSDRDIEFTARLKRDAAPIGIELVDHLIVSGPTVVSMRKLGALS